MWWMSIVGPVLLALIWLTTGRRDPRRDGEIELWRRTMGPKRVVEKERAGYRSGKQIGKPGPGARLVSALPGPLQRAVDAAGGGDAIGHYELVPKLAYLSAMAANLLTGSDLQAVTGKLEDDAPAFIVRPIPLIEGESAPNAGIEFKKDPEFTALFQVEPVVATNATPPRPGLKAAKTPPPPPSEAEQAKKIRGWLSRPVRDALRDLPDAWLYVQGRAMALVLYGSTDAAKLDELVTVADVIFAEHGEDGGPSLFNDDDDVDDVDDVNNDDDVDDEDEVEAAPPPKKSKPAASKPAASKPAAAKR
jgi:hypothetical protein